MWPWALEAQGVSPRKLYHGSREMGEQKEKLCAGAAAVYWISSCSAQPLRYTRISAEQFGSWLWGEFSLPVTSLGTHSQLSWESLGSSSQVSVQGGDRVTL